MFHSNNRTLTVIRYSKKGGDTQYLQRLSCVHLTNYFILYLFTVITAIQELRNNIIKVIKRFVYLCFHFNITWSSP
ncbi:hypothetical protein Y882_18520 [Dyella japonica DSM 16301]|uniref:Uncharacterized protein n=1 Tax=Dyella japonica DSM 16301 TaxID=1440762 RepID=A0A0G9H2F8_9GAMM|nr:hypothetical protein Y882_18520 [Dyella japonica DSM 16301]